MQQVHTKEAGLPTRVINMLVARKMMNPALTVEKQQTLAGTTSRQKGGNVKCSSVNAGTLSSSVGAATTFQETVAIGHKFLNRRWGQSATWYGWPDTKQMQWQ